MDSKLIRIGAGEHREMTLVCSEGSHRLEFELVGEGASLDLACVYICKGEMRLDFDIRVRHLVPGCTSRQLFKGLCFDSSRMEFNGLIYVAPGAEKTKAYQECHTLLVGPEGCPEGGPVAGGVAESGVLAQTGSDAWPVGLGSGTGTVAGGVAESGTGTVGCRALAIASPQLEIYADDVECSHGATVGSLDEAQLFYMRSRGIPRSEAEKLQIISFLSPVLSRLDAKARALVEKELG